MQQLLELGFPCLQSGIAQLLIPVRGVALVAWRYSQSKTQRNGRTHSPIFQAFVELTELIRFRYCSLVQLRLKTLQKI